MSIGHSPDEPQWAPDMRKDSAQVTEAEKKDARRRIQGSVSTDASPEGSGDEDGGGGKRTKAPAITSLIS
jgi:phosphatidylserine decarboxylase